MHEVLLTLMATSMACAVLGPVLVLRKLSMTADALSHSVLLGIVIAFLFVKSLDSIWLVIGAALFGLITVWVVEELSRKKLVQRDDALALVFPVFFSIAVLMITKLFRNAHIDVEVVLMGNPLFAPFIRQFGMPKAMFEMLLMLFINSIFLAVNYQKLKISTFDPEFAQLVGIKTRRLYHVFMVLVSFTCVLAFNSVGGILVISYFVAPAAAACMITKNLKYTILMSLIFGILNSWLGFYFGVLWNVSVSGMCSVAGMITVLLGIIFHRKGVLRKWGKSFIIREKFREELLMIHLFRHENDATELGFATIHQHLNWPRQQTTERIMRLMKIGLIESDRQKELYRLTSAGTERVRELLDHTGYSGKR